MERERERQRDRDRDIGYGRVEAMKKKAQRWHGGDILHSLDISSVSLPSAASLSICFLAPSLPVTLSLARPHWDGAASDLLSHHDLP